LALLCACLSRHSTTSQLLECVNDWTLSIKNKKSVDIIYVDFTKAFDSVCHSKLLLKLADYGIIGSAMNGFPVFFQIVFSVLK
jgi:hypothetical protein